LYVNVFFVNQGEEKSIVFILPKINLTQYLKQAKRKVVLTERVRLENEHEGDSVPFPQLWEKRVLSIQIPSFTLTSTDQYGKELMEV
jgi:hypothetical protein